MLLDVAGTQIYQWVILGVLVLLLIAFPFFTSRKNKRENQKLIEQTNSLKRGDEVLTTSGVYGKVLEVKQDGEAKKVVIETGNDKNKSYLTIDAYSIYAVLNKEPVKEVKTEEKKEEKKVEDKKEEKPAEKKEDKKVDASKKEVKPEGKKPVKAEKKPAGTKKASNKKSK